MQEMTLWDLFKLGGIFMYPLLIFSIATISIVIERFFYLLVHNLKMDDLRKSVIDLVKSNQIEKAKEYCKSHNKRKLGASILLAGLEMQHLGEHRIEKALESTAAEKIKKLEAGFNFLNALASISPLTGFLGTVSGMIGAFRSIANAQEVNAQLVANGIYEALITTVYGLIIAIVAISAYNIYAHIVDNFAASVENVGSELVTAMISLDNNDKIIEE